MARVHAGRVAELSTTTGTGAFTLAGALTGFRAFSSVCATNDTVSYTIEAIDGSGALIGDWETGIGTYSGANTLTRTTITASSNAGAAVNFAAGTKRVVLRSPTAPANWTLINTSGAPITSGNTWSFAVSGATANVDVTIRDWSEIRVTARGVGATISGVRQALLSVDNGSSFYTTAGDYITVSTLGVESSTTAMLFHDTAATAARTLIGTLQGLTNPYPTADCSATVQHRVFVASASLVTTLRFNNSGGGNLNSGTFDVFAR